MKIKKYRITLKNMKNSPILWNRMKKEVEDEKKKLKRTELAEWEETNWIKKAEIDSKKNAVMPREWLKSMIINACKESRIIPHWATDKRTTYTKYVQNIMIPESPIIAKDKDLEPFGAYVSAQGKGSSTKVWRVRPMLKEWKATFMIVDPYGRMKKDELKEILEYGGMFVGLGDSRNQYFGRFEVEKIEEIK